MRSLRDVLSRDVVIGDTASGGEWFARCGVDHRDREPMDRQGLLPVEPEHVMESALQGHGREAAMPVTSCTGGHAGVGLPKGQALVQLGMGIGLAPQDEVAALVQSQGTQGLLAVESIATSGPVMRRDRVGLCAYPAFACPLFTVLFGMAILRPDVLWRSGEDL